MIHQTPTGLGNPNIPTDTDVNDPLYDVFDFVWCGHIHWKLPITDKFYLGGSPLHRDLGDEGQDKGFWVQDLTNPTNVNFYSLKGRYPEYKRVKAEEIPEGMQDEYVILDPPVEVTEVDGDLTAEEFGTDLKAETILTNFYNTVHGKDDELLTTGLGFLAP
jgi:DNA repair exonuclease SbcCD nuclease subunit